MTQLAYSNNWSSAQTEFSYQGDLAYFFNQVPSWYLYNVTVTGSFQITLNINDSTGFVDFGTWSSTDTVSFTPIPGTNSNGMAASPPALSAITETAEGSITGSISNLAISYNSGYLTGVLQGTLASNNDAISISGNLLEPAQRAPFKSLNQNSVSVNISSLPIPTTDTTPPVLVNDNTLSVQFGATATITSSLLLFNDPDNSDAQETYQLVAAPSYGTLFKNGAPLSSLLTFTQADIDNGLISYQETANNAPLQDSFTFVVSDPAGNSTANTSFQIQLTPNTVVVNVQNVSVPELTSIAASSLITSVSNPNNDVITEYEFLDAGNANGNYIGEFSVNGTLEPDGQWIDVDADSLGSIQYVGGSSPGSETLYVAAYDATIGAWSMASALTATTTGLPTLLQLANFDTDVYNQNTASTVSGWAALGQAKSIGELQAQAYINPDHSQIVIAIRGTVNPLPAITSLNGAQTLLSVKDISTDLSSFTAGVPAAGLSAMVANAAQYLASIAQAYPSANITLTGHSLGGAVAQLLGEASGYTTQTFNAPGAQKLYSNLQTQLQPASNLKPSNQFLGPNQNYRTVGDLVSQYGSSIGDQFTIQGASNAPADTVGNILTNHGIDTITKELNTGGSPKSGVYEPNLKIAAAPVILSGIGNYTESGLGIVALSFAANAGLTATNLLDPGSGNTFIYTESASSPLVTSVMFLADADVASVEVCSQVNGSWSSPQIVLTGTTVSFGTGVASFKYKGLSSGGRVATLGDGYIFDATYSAASQVSATIETLVGNLSDVSDFYGNGTSDVLFRNSLTGDTWFEAMSNGAFAGWDDVGGSSTTYTVAGLGDFIGSGTDDILFRNNSTGDTWFEAMSNGAFNEWNQISGSDTHYSVVGVGDFFGNGRSDILYRNNSTGDTWFEAISNGAFNGWNQIGGSDTHYSVVGVGDFFGDGTDDILFRNNSTGDSWIEQMSSGAFLDWDQVGGSNTSYSVAGVGDFYGNGTDDILFRNNATGDTWFEAISNGAFGWHEVGGSDTHYTVVGTGDYFGNGTSDILFRNNSTGDTWFEAISNGASAGWNQIGGSNSSYTVPDTGTPPTSPPPATTTYTYNGPAFNYTSQGAPPGAGSDLTCSVTFDFDTSNATGWYGSPATIGTQYLTGLVSGAITGLSVQSGSYSATLYSNGALSPGDTLSQGGPDFHLQNGVLDQWFVNFETPSSTTFLTENWPVYTEDSLFIPGHGTGEVGGLGVWTKQ
jgi:hypothetical protein